MKKILAPMLWLVFLVQVGMAFAISTGDGQAPAPKGLAPASAAASTPAPANAPAARPGVMPAKESAAAASNASMVANATAPADPAPAKMPAPDASAASVVASGDATVSDSATSSRNGPGPMATPHYPAASGLSKDNLPSTGIGSLMQVISALIIVILFMLALAWAMKNYGPKRLLGRVPMKVVGGVHLGGRERVLVIEVADQWLVIGATPSQITPITTLPRQPMPDDEPVPGQQFSVWLKQIMEKRNG